jgi:hypothetical protein
MMQQGVSLVNFNRRQIPPDYATTPEPPQDRIPRSTPIEHRSPQKNDRGSPSWDKTSKKAFLNA